MSGVPRVYARGMRRSQLGLSDGRTLDVVEVGPKNGAPVVLFHGTPTGPLEAVTLESAAEACRVRVICAGRPGYAGSSSGGAGLSTVVGDTRELAALLGLTRWAALGISGGGPYAAAVAASLSEEVTHLAVLAGSGPPAADSGDEEDARLMALAAAGERDTAARGLATPIAEWVDTIRIVAPAAMPPGLHEAILDGTRGGYDGYVFDRFSWSLPWDVDIADAACPTDLVYGEEDAGCPPAAGEWYRSKIPHAALTIVPGADHPAAIQAGVRIVLPRLAVAQ